MKSEAENWYLKVVSQTERKRGRHGREIHPDFIQDFEPV